MINDVNCKRVFAPQFVESWQAVLCEVFNWERKDNFCLVPSLFSLKKTASLLPLLSYTNLKKTDAQKCESRILEEGIEDYRIRFLGDNHDFNLKNKIPVVMRLNIDGKSSEDIWANSMTSYCRNRARKGLKQNYILEKGFSEKLVSDAYLVFQNIMHRLGTPVLPKSLFCALAKEKIAEFYVAYKNNKPVAMLVVVVNNKITWVPWCGAIEEEMPACVNYVTHWQALQDALDRKDSIFDFGRSEYEGGTYRFKKKWGALPVPVAEISNVDSNIYQRYKVMSLIWRRLPCFLVNRLGPEVCRYIPNL